MAGILIGILLAFLVNTPKPKINDQDDMGRTPQVGGSVNVNSPAPIFSLPDLTGADMSLDQWQGKVVILNFWATWCSACLEEMPVLDDLYRQKMTTLMVIGIAVGDSQSAVEAFIKAHPVRYPILLDESGVTGATYQVLGYPTTYFLDREGIIRAKHVGALTHRILEQYFIPLGIDL